MSIPRRIQTARRAGDRDHRPQPGWDDSELEAIERAHPKGMTVQQVVAAFTKKGERLTEATFRKYVQLGLLPRSVRVGRKGKHRGSQGMYPATAVRQLDRIRRLMAQGYTMEEIQQEFLFVRGDIEALGRQLVRVYDAIEDAIAKREAQGGADPLSARALSDAKALGDELLEELRAVEGRLTMAARMDRAVV